MTGNEIKKALECCSIDKSCCDCSYYCGHYCVNSTCLDSLDKDALAYINQLEAEVERLKSLNKTQGVMVNELNKACKNMKSEAIKEFADKLKSISHPYFHTQVIFESQIDNIVKENGW